MKRRYKPKSPIYSKISISGDPLPSGVYLLAIQLMEDCEVSFGKFQHGRLIPLPEGTYIYVGSAFGHHRTSSLGYRLLRHASRSDKNMPHRIRPALQSSLEHAGLLGNLPKRKTTHWHIDYFLDLLIAEIRGIAVKRTNKQIEAEVAKRLADQPETFVIAPRLGASDYPSGTHLFFVDADSDWWLKLPQNLK